MLRQSMSDTELSSNTSAVNAMVQLKQLSGELQESVMIRAQPVRVISAHVPNGAKQLVKPEKRRALSCRRRHYKLIRQ